MKVMISYFYQIRFFTPNMIPLSTAMFDPKWYHSNRSQEYHFKDRRKVYNGLRADPFVPGPLCTGLCAGDCKVRYPQDCAFLKAYKKQLNQLDFDEMLQRFERLGNFIKDKEGFDEEPIMILIVHEAPNNPCSERWPLIEWFNEHGYNLKEFDKNQTL